MTRPAAVAALLVLGCAAAGGLMPIEPGSSVGVPADTALTFHGRAEIFYRRLIQRRFNTLETFNDSVLRRHFQSRDLFFDYYAGLAEQLMEAHFEKSRPSSVELQEFVFEDPTRVQVQVRFVGADRRPMRPGEVVLIRRDHWVWSEGHWWISPGKL